MKNKRFIAAAGTILMVVLSYVTMNLGLAIMCSFNATDYWILPFIPVLMMVFVAVGYILLLISARLS